MPQQPVNLRILIIDDNTAIQNDFIKVLIPNTKKTPRLAKIEDAIFGKEENEELDLPEFHIDTASQGNEGVQYIANAIKENNPYALAFVDIRMPPGWDGIETIKHIWKLDADIQIVICTAFSDYSWEDTVKELGQRENLLILKKPFDDVAVRQLSCALTKKWQLLRESKNYTKLLEERVEERTYSLQQSLDKIEFQATHDPLTKLPNRALLFDRIQQAIVDSIRNNTRFGLLFYDIDRFKLINDSFSHHMGDKLLKDVAQRITSSIREMDTFARLGGDEFVSIITSLKGDDFYIYLARVANKILEVCRKPFNIANREVAISTSIGIAIFKEHGDDIPTLLRNADAAMYRSKEFGGNQFQFYTKEMDSYSLEKLELESELFHALENNEFVLYYQPQVNTFTSKLVSVEALIRWQHPKKGLIMPIDFVPYAEKTGQIIAIGEWVLRTACKQNKTWQDMGLPKFRVAVNITTHQLNQSNLLTMIQNILNEMALSPEYLELELSEKSVINGINTVNTIMELKSLGIHLAVDDFGTGYSSLNYLKHLPLDRIKIDQSFVKNIDVNRGDEVIIKAIISMAKDLNLDIMAEGVETIQQLEFLKSIDCREIQGFYLSKPLPATELEQFIKEFTTSNLR